MIGIGGAGQAMQFDDELHMAASPFIDDGKGGGVLEPVAPSVNKDSIERDAMEESEMRSTLPPRALRISDHTDFNQSPNIEDRRDIPPPTLGEQFNDDISRAKSKLFGPAAIPAPDVPDNQSGMALGMQDIKAPNRSFFENVASDAKYYGNMAISDITGTNILTGKLVTAARDMYRGYDDNYNTLLFSEDQDKYKDWKSKYAPNDKGDDYDLQGAFKAGITPSEKDGHFPDTFKKPSHMTFSDESKYSTPDNPGGHWQKLEDNPDYEWSFSPGKANLQHHSIDDLKEYFKREPNSRLDLPE